MSSTKKAIGSKGKTGKMPQTRDLCPLGVYPERSAGEEEGIRHEGGEGRTPRETKKKKRKKKERALATGMLPKSERCKLWKRRGFPEIEQEYLKRASKRKLRSWLQSLSHPINEQNRTMSIPASG